MIGRIEFPLGVEGRRLEKSMNCVKAPVPYSKPTTPQTISRLGVILGFGHMHSGDQVYRAEEKNEYGMVKVGVSSAKNTGARQCRTS